mmetsp:Transcript_35309/g.64730  ORF Transcript_35309/g.64730 Transcript_35309/m.64730 type:complete len:231 (-) Transcript_35309:159-851(-)
MWIVSICHSHCHCYYYPCHSRYRFYNFCRDMNDPFDGVYQIKRSSAAAYLMQIKWLIANQPFGKDIKFDTRGLAPVYDGNEVYDIGKVDLRVEPSSSSGLPPKPSETVVGANKEPEPQQEVATPMKTPAPGVSITIDSPKASKVNVVVRKASSVKAFIPERKKTPSDDGAQDQSETTNEEMVSQFGSLSGFSGAEPEGEGVTVPTKTMQNEPIDKRKISMYFRKSGGFGE